MDFRKADKSAPTDIRFILLMYIIDPNTHQPELPHTVTPFPSNRVTLSRREGSLAPGREMLRGGSA